MTTQTIPAYVTTVAEGHTIVLPEEIPVGATVAVVVVSVDTGRFMEDERRQRFATTLAAIRAASPQLLPSLPSDTDIDTLILLGTRYNGAQNDGAFNDA